MNILAPLSCVSDLQEEVCRKPVELEKFRLDFGFSDSLPLPFFLIFNFCVLLVDLSRLQLSLWLSSLP